MQVRHIPCGPFANESEAKAIQYLISKLTGLQGNGLWILLSNLPFSVNNAGSSSEIDIVAIGPTGLHVIETKHWDFRYVDAAHNRPTVELEAEKLQTKAKVMATSLRKTINVGFLAGKFFLTRTDDSKYTAKTKNLRGTTLFSLKDWKALLNVDAPGILSNQEIENLSLLIEPKTKAALTGDVRSFSSYINLERVSDKSDAFRRVYKGIHAKNRDKVILYVYDYSATDESNCDTIARREFETVRKLQKSPWLSRLVESFQDAPEYPGELFFFSVADPCAPTLQNRSTDKTWTESARITFAIQSLGALKELHDPLDNEIPVLIHRNISPASLHVRVSGKPLFGGFNLTKLEGLSTIAGAPYRPEADAFWVSPEVKKNGLSAADKASDVYSLCSCLKILFENAKITSVLDLGLSEDPTGRTSLDEISTKLRKLAEPSAVPENILKLPDARYWDEDLEIPFRDSLYRIVNRLGAGGWGTTFKVVQIDVASKEELGTFVAKTIHNAESAKCAIDAYRKARPLCNHSHLATIYEITNEWQANQIAALMNWIEGMPLSDLIGLVQQYAEEIDEKDLDAMLLRWIKQLCEALRKIHQSGFVHGDVTPKNIIVSNGDLVLTDYDLFTPAGEIAMSKGTIEYCSPNMELESAIGPSDDIYSLGASFFHLMFDRPAFEYNGERRKVKGCNQDGIDASIAQNAYKFVLKATAPERENRFTDANDALKFLSTFDMKPEDVQVPHLSENPHAYIRAEVNWLYEVLRTYPGSIYGNTETRGLDTEFAVQTYVRTNLETSLIEKIQKKETRLVILTGNAGDGKTAFLQHLAMALGVKADKSSMRIVEGALSDGTNLKINLDGSASFKGTSSSKLLDDLFSPFQQLSPEPLVHMVAVNSGPLLSWMEDAEARLGPTPFLQKLQSVIEEESEAPSWLAYIDFNNRSLVGGLDRVTNTISSDFLDRIIDSMMGGQRAAEIWSPCQSCVSRVKCPVADSVSRLRGISPYSTENSNVFRERLFAALRAAHQRGEIHITARELRAALTYVIFGTKGCNEIHESDPTDFASYGDLAFDPNSPHRQGLLLAELAKLDPALESHPIIDRYLETRKGQLPFAARSTNTTLSLASLRRQAYFQMGNDTIAGIACEEGALALNCGKYFQQFLRYPLMDNDSQETILHSLCYGLSRLVDIPSAALARKQFVPIRVTPRTPTETTFWVEKPYGRFKLEAIIPDVHDGLETLHTHLLLSYTYDSGDIEYLEISANLFGVLMDISQGFQLSGAALDDTFANLSIFCERLAQEDQEYLLAWHPAEETSIYKIHQTTSNRKRVIKIESTLAETDSSRSESRMKVEI